jgi:hypothetical protein
VDVEGTDEEGTDEEGRDDDEEGTDDDEEETDEEETDEEGTDEDDAFALGNEANFLSESSKVSLDTEVSDDDSIIKGFFFCGFSVIILYIMNIIYILVILY